MSELTRRGCRFDGLESALSQPIGSTASECSTADDAAERASLTVVRVLSDGEERSTLVRCRTGKRLSSAVVLATESSDDRSTLMHRRAGKRLSSSVLTGTTESIEELRTMARRLGGKGTSSSSKELGRTEAGDWRLRLGSVEDSVLLLILFLMLFTVLTSVLPMLFSVLTGVIESRPDHMLMLRRAGESLNA
jgi:hypothetical protein